MNEQEIMKNPIADVPYFFTVPKTKIRKESRTIYQSNKKKADNNYSFRYLLRETSSTVRLYAYAPFSQKINTVFRIGTAEAGEGLTMEEVQVYQRLVKPVKHVYGKYGTLAKKYLEEHNVGKYWSIVDLPEYLHGVDAAADRMWTAMYEKLSKMEKYRKTGEFMHDLRVQEEMHRVIEEEILNEIVYV